MVQTTEVRYGSDPAFSQNWPSQRRIFVQRQMTAGTIVILGVGAEYVAQMHFAENDQMVQTFPSDRSDQPLNIGVLPWRTWCRGTIPDPHSSDTSPEHLSVSAIAITDEESGRRVPRKGLGDLPSDPVCRWVGSDRDMNQPAPVMAQDEKTE